MLTSFRQTVELTTQFAKIELVTKSNLRKSCIATMLIQKVFS